MLGMFGLGCMAGIQQVQAEAGAHVSFIHVRLAATLVSPQLAVISQSTHVFEKKAAPVVPSPVAAKSEGPHSTGVIRRPIVKTSPGSSVGHLAAVSTSEGSQPSASTEPQVPNSTNTSTPPSSPTSTAPHSSAAEPSYTYTSSNWSGYMAVGSDINGVSGSWVVPRATGSGLLSADAAWVGVGGVTTDDLIQAGTDDSISSNGSERVEAFYEMLPESAIAIPGMIVEPGDAVSANLKEVQANQWDISMNDVTEGESFSTTLTYASSGSSAEWIEEDPSFSNSRQIPFDSFGAVTFSNAAETVGGTSFNLSQAGALGIAMVNSSGSAEAVPSTIGGDGGSFSVTGVP